MKYVTIINNREYEVEIEKDGTIRLNGEPRQVDFSALGPSLYSVITEDISHEVVIDELQNGMYDVLMSGRMYEAKVLDERMLLMARRQGTLTAGTGEINSPMPGLIVAVNVAVGDQVAPGQTVVILESMKMQNELKSPVSGTVVSIQVSVGNTVEKNAALLVVQPDEE